MIPGLPETLLICFVFGIMYSYIMGFHKYLTPIITKYEILLPRVEPLRKSRPELLQAYANVDMRHEYEEPPTDEDTII